MSVRLADRPFAAERELAEFTAGLDGEGAVVSFLGIARARTADGETVDRLVLDHHPRLTLASLEAIAAAARSASRSRRFGSSIAAAPSRRARRSCSSPPPRRTAAPRSRPPTI